MISEVPIHGGLAAMFRPWCSFWAFCRTEKHQAQTNCWREKDAWTP